MNAALRKHIVPWTPRDVWVGIACQWLLWLVNVLVLALIPSLRRQLNLGMFIIWTELLWCMTVWLLAVRKYRGSWAIVGLRRFPGKALVWGCGLLLLYGMCNHLYLFLLALCRLRIPDDLGPGLVRLSPWWLWIGSVVAAPMVEELFFRGFVFGGLRPRYGWQKAAVISAALFAAVHLPRWGTLPLQLVFGYLLAYLYERSNSIWPGILMHAWVNASVLGSAYFTIQ
jgi:membrane protease YdiL (CAAX protease family)